METKTLKVRKEPAFLIKLLPRNQVFGIVDMSYLRKFHSNAFFYFSSGRTGPYKQDYWNIERYED